MDHPLELFYLYNWKDLVDVTTYWCDLYDISNEKVGILLTNRFVNTKQDIPPDFTYTPI
jgi:hypothetical protein